MPATAIWRREVFVLFGAVLLRAVRAADLSCLSSLRELEPLHRVGKSGSRLMMCRAVQLRAVRIVSHELFVHSERIRTVTLGVCIYFLCLTPVLLLLLKYIINEEVCCSQNSKMYA